MGVKELWPILEPVGQTVTLSDLQGKKVAIDLSIWIRESDVIQGVGKPYLRNIFWRVLHLLRHQVTPVFVVDGAPPSLKNAELERRLHGTPRKKASPAPPPKFSPRGKNAQFEEQIRESCELLDSVGVCYVHSDGEAEATCAQLNLHGVVDGCVTQDGDAFLFGAHTVYRNFTCNSQKSDQMCVYHMKDIRRDLGLTRRHLVSLALLLGCDYYNGVKSVGRKYAEDFMKEIKGHDPIEKLKELRTGAFYKRLTTLGSTTKRRHCLRCQHPGSKDVHRKQGCILCKSEGGCDDNKADHACPCPFHADKRQLAEHTAGIKIYKQVQHDTDFPPQQVVDAFLKPTYRTPDHELEWRKPSIEKLQTFNRHHLQWGSDKMEARFVPLFTAWDLSHPEETSLLPLRILKIFHDHGQKMIEVEWKYEDRSLQIGRKEAVMTKEYYEVMSDVHPDLVSGFEAEQKKTPKSTKTPAKRKMLKAAAECRTIGDMFKEKKPRIEAAAGKANNDIMEATKVTAQTNGKHSSEQKDSKLKIKAVTDKADDVVEVMKGGTQTNGNHSATRKDTKPGARVSLFSRFEGLLQNTDSSIETSLDEDSTELPDISFGIEKPGSSKASKKTIDQQAIAIDTNNDDHDVNVLKASPVPIPKRANKPKTAFSTENGESDAKSPMGNTKSTTFDIPEAEESDTNMELIIDTSSESSLVMETNTGEGVSHSNADHYDEVHKGECRSAEGHIDEGHTDVGYTDEGHTDEGHTNEGHSAGPPDGNNGVPEVCPMDAGGACQEHSNTNKPSLEEQPSGSFRSEVLTKSTRSGGGSDSCPTVFNGAGSCNEEGSKDECHTVVGHTKGHDDAGRVKGCNVTGHTVMGRVLRVRLEKVDAGGVQQAVPSGISHVREDRGVAKNSDTNLNGNEQESVSPNTKPKAEIINLGDEEKDHGEEDSDEDIFVVKQSQPETSEQQNGTDEEHELPRLRRRAARKQPAMKPKVKTRSKKKFKDCSGQPKIRDMFSVKKQSGGMGLKMVLVRK